MGLWVKRPTLGSQLQQPLRLPTGETKLRYEEGISREQFILDGGGSCFPPGRSSGQLFPRSRCLPGEGPKRDQSKITMPPTPLPAGRGREKGSPSLLSKPRPAGKECHVFLFPINSPPHHHQQPSAFLRPRVKTATGESWESWRELHWWLGLGLKGSPPEPEEPHPHPRTFLPGLGACR